jgi:hypothetical protein
MKVLAWVRDRVARAGFEGTRRALRKPRAHASPFAAQIDCLELRRLLSSAAAVPVAVTDLVRAGSGAGVKPLNSAGPTGYTPAQIRHAYGFDQVSFSGAAADGTGSTIAIVDAYDDPNIANDLHRFDVAFGLTDPPSFTKINQNGSTGGLPRANSGWITEIALDVEWAHAIAPGAKILLVEAASNSYSDLMTAVNTARNSAGVDVVSMSWGGSEDPSQTAFDGTFTTPNGHTGVTFVASSGDSGAPTSYPSSSPNVVSVGGTTLFLTANGTWTSEIGWSGSGGGISSIESQPAYQKGIVSQSGSFRTNPDVAYDADPNTGFGVYDSYNNGTRTPWGQWGGTSDAAPQWAALIAIADQGRLRAGAGTLDGATQTLPMLYAMSAADFHDITSGTSSGAPQYSARPGYDLVTGRGSPNANLVINDLIGVVQPPTLTSVSTLGVAYSPTPYNIPYATLLAASNAADSNGQPIQFRITAVQNGTLSIVHNNATSNVVPGLTNGTLFGPGDTLVWTPPGSAKNAVNAFAVVAFDGTANSAQAVPVAINVQALGFDLSGPWVVRDATGNVLGLGSVSQSSAGVTVTPPGAAASAAQFTGANQMTASNFDGQSSVVGTIDTSVPDQGRMAWSDGTFWVRVSLGGQYVVNGQLASIIQSGTTLTINPPGGGPVTGVINSPTQVTASGFGGAGTYADGVINFGNGQAWTKLDLPSNYTTSAGGGATQVVPNGTTTLGFVNSQRQSFGGNFTDPMHLIVTSPATGFPVNTTATIAGGKITWSTGEVWSESLSIRGTNPAGGQVSLSVTPTLITLVNPAGQISFANITGPNTIVVVAGAMQGLTGTRVNGGINWSNGGTWLNFDLNALNAAFAANITSQNVPLVLNGTNSGSTAVTILSSAGQISLIASDGSISHGQLTGPRTITAIDGVLSGITFTLVSAGKVNLSNGGVWSGFDTVGLNTLFDGTVQPGTVPPVVNGTNVVGTTVTLTFSGGVISLIASDGSVSHGQLTGANTIKGIDGALNNITLTLTNAGKVMLSNGGVWNNFDPLALNAFYNGPLTPGAVPSVINGDNAAGTTVSIIFDGTQLSLIASNGSVSHAQVTSATTIVAIDGAMNGLTLTLAGNGKLNISNGGVWSNFDPTALSALFTNVPHFPFPP